MVVCWRASGKYVAIKLMKTNLSGYIVMHCNVFLLD